MDLLLAQAEKRDDTKEPPVRLPPLSSPNRVDACCFRNLGELLFAVGKAKCCLFWASDIDWAVSIDYCGRLHEGGPKDEVAGRSDFVTVVMGFCENAHA